MQFIWRYWEKISLALQECKPFLPSSKHESLLYYLYYTRDSSGFSDKSTFPSTWQTQSKTVQDLKGCMGEVKAQGKVLIFFIFYFFNFILLIQCWSEELMFCTIQHPEHSDQSAVSSGFQAENNLLELKPKSSSSDTVKLHRFKKSKR